MPVVHEAELGIEQMVDDLERSFHQSCEHNGTNCEDQVYFRRYVFMLTAMIMKKQSGR